MNCSQARRLLSAYRELKNNQQDTTEVDMHLEGCPACREVLAQSSFIGERLHALPTIAPAPDAHAKLMQALATEHARFLQHSPATAPSPPDFLKPYIQEHANTSHKTNTLAAFSTAETGPLPIIRAKRRRRAVSISPIAIVGLAAVFLMVIMASGLVSLLALANHGLPNTSAINVSIGHPAQVAMARYTTATPYTHIVSAVADNHQYIYYTAYGDNTTAWMLERADTQSKTQPSTSVPLLSTESASPLIVLGSSQNWLVWLQFDAPKPSTTNHNLHGGAPLTRTWSLHSLYLGAQPAQVTPDSLGSPNTLLKGTFNQSVVPSWVHTPIQGIWFTQNTLLITYIGTKGYSHLVQYQLDPTHSSMMAEIATSTTDHVLTSPTASSDGTMIYWSEEWVTDGNVMHGNIWSQEQTNAIPTYGRWIPHTTITKQEFRNDEMSFHPQIVGDTLFWLSTADTVNTTQGTSSTQAKSSPTVTPGTTTGVTNGPIIAKSDPNIYLTQIDASIRGTLLASSLNDSTQPSSLNGDGLATAPQAGTRFLLWQNDKGDYEMYDAIAKSPVSVDNVPKGAAFLAVNGNTAVWTVSDQNSTGAPGLNNSLVSFKLFRWPLKISTITQ